MQEKVYNLLRDFFDNFGYLKNNAVETEIKGYFDTEIHFLLDSSVHTNYNRCINS